MDKRPEPPPEGALITAALARARLSARKAAAAAGISEGWWRQIVRGYQTLSGGGYGPVRGPADTLARMAHVAGVTPEELEEVGRQDAAEELRRLGSQAEPDAESASDIDEEELVRRFKALPPDARLRALRELLDDVRQTLEPTREEEERKRRTG